MLAGANRSANESPVQIQIWQVATGTDLTQLKILERFEIEQQQIQWMAFSADGRALYTIGREPENRESVFQRWDLASCQSSLSFSLPAWTRRPNGAIALCRDRCTLALAFPDQTVGLWDLKTGKKIRSLAPFSGPINTLAFSSDGTRLAIGVQQTGIRVVDSISGAELFECKGHNGWMAASAFSPDGKYLATIASDDCVIHLWNARTGEEVSTPEAHTARITGLGFSADGRTLLSGSWDGSVRWWETATGKPMRQGCLPEVHPCNSFAMVPGGPWLVAGDRDGGDVLLWHPLTGEEIHRWHGRSGAAIFNSNSLSVDSRRLVFAVGSTAHVLDLATARDVCDLAVPAGETISAAALSPDGRRAAISCEDANSEGGILRLYDAASGRLLRVLGSHQGSILALAFSPDSRTLASAGVCHIANGSDNINSLPANYGDGFRLWDVATGRELRECGEGSSIHWHGTRTVAGLAFSPDGKALASAENDGRVIAYEAATGKPREELVGHQGPVRALAYSADGRLLASSGYEHSALIWDMTLGSRNAIRHGGSPPDGETDRCWKALASLDAVEAYRAMSDLAGINDRAVSFLADRISAADASASTRIPQLLEDLDNDSFMTREQAVAALEKLGPAAAPALQQALAGSPSLESRRRMEALLEKVQIRPLFADDLRYLRALEILEHLRSPASKRLLEAWSHGAPEARLTREAKASLTRIR
jgi:WD40 repeat protein